MSSAPGAASLEDQTRGDSSEPDLQDVGRKGTPTNDRAESPSSNLNTALSAAQEKKLWRKIDLRLLPIVTLIFLLSFMDRSNIGNAKLDGLMTQLNLTGNRYNVALTMFLVPYAVFEFPSNLLIQVIRPSRYIPMIMVLWGISMTLMGLVKTYPELVVVRVFLGVTEAGFVPGIAYYFTMWYPRYMYQYRYALFNGAATLAGAFSGLLAYAIHFMNDDDGLEGWSWIFILEGIATVLVALIAFSVMVDYPSTASFLSAEERAFISKRRQQGATYDEDDRIKQQIWAAFIDWQVWALSIVQLSFVAPGYGIAYFLPTIINDFGYNTSISQLLTVPPYVLSFFVLLSFAYYSDKLEIRFPFIFISQVIGIAGFILNISNASSGVKYFGTFLCVTGAYAGLPGCISWLANNLGGKYKRAVGMAIQICVGNLGGAIACNVYRTQDAPRYLLGHGVEIMFIGLGMVTIPVTVLLYRRINAEKEHTERFILQGGKGEGGFARNLGDKAPGFRYTI